MKTLTVEIREGLPLPDGRLDALGMVQITPPINEEFWLLRVKLSEHQAIVAFPKFGVIGCGFAVEKDWNTNLPLVCSTDQLFNHIKHNKGNKGIKDEDCRRAIDLLRDTAIKLGLFTREDCDHMKAKGR